MENTQFGSLGQENQIANLGQETDQSAVESNNDYGNVFPTSDFYDEGGNYRADAFENLGSLHYMNYLHSHDDML